MACALAFTVQAADMRVPAYRVPAAAVFNWTGCYAGGQVGALWTSNFNSASRWLYGGQVGCNWQQPGSTFVWGVEGDLAGASRQDSDVVRVGTEGSVRVRAGFTANRTLYYVGGGWSEARVNASAPMLGDGTLSSSLTRNGWNIGAGAEYAWINNWTIGVEYRYTDYGSFNRTDATALVPVTVSTSLRTSDVRLRLNYLFGSALGLR
jgi:outer membrane immunogenic protein